MLNKSHTIYLLVIATVMTVSCRVQTGWAQGDNHGPRAGYVQGTLELNSELIQNKDDSLTIYIMDSNWMDRELKGATVSVTVERNRKAKIKLECKIAENSANCTLPKKERFQAQDKIRINYKAKDPTTQKDKEYQFEYRYPFTQGSTASNKW